jgi:hypothetical protein
MQNALASTRYIRRVVCTARLVLVLAILVEARKMNAKEEAAVAADERDVVQRLRDDQV